MRTFRQYFKISDIAFYSVNRTSPTIELSCLSGNSELESILNSLLIKNNYNIETIRGLKNKSCILFVYKVLIVSFLTPYLIHNHIIDICYQLFKFHTIRFNMKNI